MRRIKRSSSQSSTASNNSINGKCASSWQYPQTISSIGDIPLPDIIRCIIGEGGSQRAVMAIPGCMSAIDGDMAMVS